MVIVSAKVSKRKILAGVLAAAAVIALLVFLFTKSEEPSAPEDPAQILEAATNEARVAYLQSFGWQVQETPTETQEVRIPEEFNEVFTRYNQLQQSMGFDLSDYAGKSAKRYVYAVTNHPSGNPDYYATVLIYKNKIIGGDVTSTAQGGKMHGFEMPEAS